jgi:hypothetical protein
MSVFNLRPKSTLRLSVLAAYFASSSFLWGANQAITAQDNTTNELVIVAFLGMIVVGIFLGLSGRAVVFRDYDDLALVFACGVCTIVGLCISDARFISLSLLLLGLGLALATIARTGRDNGFLLLPIILVTKIALSVLWIFYVIQAVNPGGKTTLERSRQRGAALLVLAILTPLVARLVRNHEGFLTRSPETITDQ